MDLNLINKKNKMNGLDLLSKIDSETIKICFFDPQYRGVLDKLAYGNEGKSRGKARSELPQMNETVIHEFINEINRVLVKSGYLFLWIDKFHLLDGVKSWLQGTDFEIVDMVTWNKMKIGMGYRTRRKSEYLVVIQKAPKKAKSTWVLHNIPDVWDERLVNNKNGHPHSKPIELQKQLILATTLESDIVLDPASGGYSVFRACQEINRNFIGCDLLFGDSNE